MKKNEAITLIALIITILVLLILAGITLNLVLGENGILSKSMETRQKQIIAQMRESLSLSLQELQIEKLGQATLDDLTQEWLDHTIKGYTCTLKNDTTMSGKIVTMQKDGITGKFLIDEVLNIVEMIVDESSIGFEYEVISKDGEDIKIQIEVTENTNGIKQIQTPDGNTINGQGNKQVQFEYIVTLGVEYEFKIASESGEQKTEKLKIEDYYYTITKNLADGISMDNKAIKAAYNKPYEANLTAEDGYIIDSITVTMGDQTVAVDKTTGSVHIEKVTGDITITATAKKMEIVITNQVIGSTNPPTSNVADNAYNRGTPLYINFNATLDGIACTLTPSVPYQITSNGTYQFTATAEYQGKTITKEIEIKVNKYQSAVGLVKYDAGEWTQEEIQELETNKLYNINVNNNINTIFKLNSDNGLNFTFGGFTYKGSSYSKVSGVVTNRNQSVSSNDGGNSDTLYEGWRILEKKEENGKTYVTKIVHAGTPETFVYHYTENFDSYRAEYLLSNGQRQKSYSKLGTGTTINTRSWDMYKDKNQLDLIDSVHCMTYDEALPVTGGTSNPSGVNYVGAYYWLSSAYSREYMYSVTPDGRPVPEVGYYCWGIRPVVRMVEGVYIKSGDGTVDSPYILAKE